MDQIKAIINHINDFSLEMRKKNVASFASSIAFYFCMALFPTVLLLCMMIRYLPITQADLISLVEQFLPEALDDTVAMMIRSFYRISTGMIPVLGLFSLWAAGAGVMGLIRGLNGVFQIEDSRNFIVLRAISCLYTLILLIGLLLSIVVMGFGNVVLERLQEMSPALTELIRALYKLKEIFIWFILFLMFELAYTFLPAKRRRLVLQIPGAIFSATGWCVGSWGFRIYIDELGGYSNYGSFMTIMVFLVLMYFYFSILMMGAYINKYYTTEFGIFYVFIRQKRAQRKADKLQQRVSEEITEDD